MLDSEIAPPSAQAHDDLDARLLQAHATQDAALLAALYAIAADAAETCGDVDAACFYLTHAMVFALEANADTYAALRQRLQAHGRIDADPHAPSSKDPRP